ncbi:hypothetical protein [Bradyrhizobium elkanii]|uniref:hypothetical protein n=1 Tax=Bradyrhizobium elkanii TaxID=29448 RepID=UPI0004B761D2|nr:hypothetical protein [Bradyrhizobium elkanii]WLA79573.1 hypothetical protein QNJ99_29775 [Bradyrhizobium elkanii]
MADKQGVNGTKLEKIPIAFQLGDNVIDGVVIRPMTFQMFVDCISEAQSMKDAKTFEAKLRRLRMVKQVSYYINGSVVPVSMEDVLKLPIPDARKIVAKLDDAEGKAGKIIRDGDGIDQAITYELGTPIPTGQGKPPISELEFHARTYGDIEDVMAAPDSIQQASLLIATLAKPLGTSLTLLPSWAMNLITVADGVTISRDVLPRFLGSPVE